MHRLTPSLFLLLAPAIAFALDFSQSPLPYPDVRDGSAEEAGVRVLTQEGIVSGYPDGTFQPTKKLNRAEFLKIVIESHPDLRTTNDDRKDCFPDVKAADWFSRYVCYAKDHDIVSGYPDGTFQPAKEVNYAEALKMLAEVYEYDLPEPADNERWAWYTAYIRAAEEHDVALADVDPAHELTRGEMARLAAAYLSEHEGELDNFHRAEQGLAPVTSSSSSASSNSSASSTGSGSSSSVSSSSSSSSISSSGTGYTLAFASQFLLIGQTGAPIAGGAIAPQTEPTIVTSARVTLQQEIFGVEEMEIVTADGTMLTTLRRRTTTDDPEYRLIYEWFGTVDNGAKLPAGTHTVFVRPKLREAGNGGSSNEIITVRRVELSLYQTLSQGIVKPTFSGPFPQNQSTFGKIKSVTALSPASAPLETKTIALMGRFAFSGTTVLERSIRVQHLIFAIQQAGDAAVSATNWHLLAVNGERHDCTVGSEGVNCYNIPATMGSIGSAPRVLSLHADLLVAGSSHVGEYQISLARAGSLSQLGSVQWTDEVGSFRWVEGPSPVASGTLYRK